ncbi:prephenate dehydrogenase [Microbispora bryophytorum]|uniref:Prephenate dehydrogenase n=1 Tax=Microbispora bryophytorum TaxID=1460882 RepID=A0A8H9H831_9ACTN|nr:prephenate dehydrogenase [Microbispora bryophytorum]GGO23533.1 prephenate dehydrogenase [Microbispora bryophytorum]
MRTMAVVGTGLIGTSVGLAVSRHGVMVHLLDQDETAARTAAALGAGVAGAPAERVDLAVIAVPPSRVGAVLAEQQLRGLAHAYTDVASVKSAPARDVLRTISDPVTFVGGHPLAGRERSGPLAARADLFEDRSWVLTPTQATSQPALNRVLEMVALCGAIPVVMEDQAHDAAVALTSHAPHVVASLMAARLQAGPEEAFRLAGQGLRDVTRIAAGDPRLWRDILQANAAAVARVLRALNDDLSAVLAALDDLAAAEPVREGHSVMRIEDLLRRGIAGLDRIHGRRTGTGPGQVRLRVALGERPGELALLVARLAEFGVGLDDVAATASPDRGALFAEFGLSAIRAEAAQRALTEEGWAAERLHPITAPAGSGGAAGVAPLPPADPGAQSLHHQVEAGRQEALSKP